MGLLNRFKNSEKSANVNYNQPKQENRQYSIGYDVTPDGKLQVEFYNDKREINQFYDTTRLIIDGRPEIMENQEVYNCLVSWYGQSDCSMLDNKTGKFESRRASNYRKVLAQINPNLLRNDEAYCRMVMEALLDQERVEKYLEIGMQENPNQPCGEYIGGVARTDKGYNKFFSLTVGRAAHNTPSMIEKREKKRAKMEEQRRRDIDLKKAKMQQLQNEIDDLSK